MGAAALNSPSAAFGALGFGNGIMDGGLGPSATNDLDHGATGLSEIFENQLSLTGVDGIRGADDVLQREINFKNVSGSGWICRSPRPHELVLTTSSNPSTPPRSASSSSSTFSFPPSPSSTTSAGSAAAAFMFSKQQQQFQLQNGTTMPHPPRLQGGNGALSGGTSLGLVTGAKTLYSTPPPPSLHLPPIQNGNANGIVGQASHLAGGLAPQVFPLPALPAHLLPARQAHNPFLLPTTTPTPAGNTNANANPLLTTLTNILAPSGLRLSQGGRVRNVCPDASNPILMFWPDNEPLPTLGQCRPPLPSDYSHSGKKDADVAKSNGLPPILNTGNVGPMEKQPLDWTCGVCKYINWRRRKVCQCCFPYAPGNEPPANHEDKLKVISALLTSTSASGPAASLPLGPTAAAFASTTAAFNPAAAGTAPSFASAAPTPLAAAQHQLVQQIQRDQHQLLQIQLQLQIQKAQAQLNLFTQQQQQQQQRQQQAAVQGGMGLGMGGGMITSAPGSASSSEMDKSRTGSPFVLGSNGASTTTNFATTPGPIGKPTSTSSTPSPLSIYPGTSSAKKSIWAMDGETGTPTSSTSAAGSPSSTARSSPTSFTAVDPEATVKLGSSNWFGSVAAQTSNTVLGNKFGEIGSGKVSPLRLGEGVTRKASLPISQIAWPSPPLSASSRTGSPAVFGSGALVPSSSSSSSLPSLAGSRAPGAGMGLGNGLFGMGNAGLNGGSMLF
ncbi:hypothetical protein FRC00_002746 [Tulasnella sp. 408]|nr:hypothetical protein FRC00_002746 [Tulasnella sp. 408]